MPNEATITADPTAATEADLTSVGSPMLGGDEIEMSESVAHPLMGGEGFVVPGQEEASTEEPVTPAGETPAPTEEEAAAAAAEAAKAAEAAGAAPVEIEVDGAKVKVDDLTEAYKTIAGFREAAAAAVEDAGGAPIEQIITSGVNYQKALTLFNSGEEGARAVIQTFINAATEAYGAGVANIEVPVGIDPETLTANEKSLYGQLSQKDAAIKALQASQDSLTKQFKEFVDTTRPVVESTSQAALVTKAVSALKAELPAFATAITAETITEAMKTTGETDPIKAYKLANFGKVPGQVTAEPRVVQTPRSPGATVEKTFDPMDPKLSGDDIVALMVKGYRPVASAPAKQ